MYVCQFVSNNLCEPLFLRTILFRGIITNNAMGLQNEFICLGREQSHLCEHDASQWARGHGFTFQDWKVDKIFFSQWHSVNGSEAPYIFFIIHVTEACVQNRPVSNRRRTE